MSSVIANHEPLPYLVTLTRMTSTGIQTREVSTVAYSVIEAVMQASMEASGGSTDGSVSGVWTCKSVSADAHAYANRTKPVSSTVN